MGNLPWEPILVLLKILALVLLAATTQFFATLSFLVVGMARFYPGRGPLRPTMRAVSQIGRLKRRR